MAFLSPATRIDSHRLPRHLLLVALAVLAAAVVLALMPRSEAPPVAAQAAPPSAGAPQADPPLRVPAEPVETTPAVSKLPTVPASAPVARRPAPVEAGEASRAHAAAAVDNLAEDAAAAGMTSRAEADSPVQH